MNGRAFVDIPRRRTIDQLRVVLTRVSPLIWRRLQLSSATTIYQLHGVLQATLGWDDSHLHAFRIHGREYGASRLGGISFSDDPRKVRLCDFRLRPRERFQYRYNFNDAWELEIRIETILPVDPSRRYPTCTAGQRVALPEDCGGVEAYLELLDHHGRLPLEELTLISSVVKRILDGQSRDAVENWEEFEAAAERLKNHLRFTKKSIDRKSINSQLEKLTMEPGEHR